MQEAAQALFQLAAQAGTHPRITSTFRTYAQQARLYQAYLAGRAPYLVARPGTSAHEFGLAFDMVVEGSVNQEDCGTVWVQWGGVYGGKRDPVHFEAPGFKSPISDTSMPSASDTTGLGTPGNVWEQLSDLLIYFVPGAGILKSIVGTTALASTLYSILGGQANLAVWYLSHPAEAVRDLFAVWRGALKTLYGL